MGWTTCYTAKHWKLHKGRNIVDRKAECDDLYTFQGKDETGRIISSTRVIKSTMHGSVWYGACETVKDGKATVWAGVCLTCGKSPDGTIWGYKAMDESVGPFYHDCPGTILNLLTEPTTESAATWRKECEKNTSLRKVSKFIKLPDGITANYRGGWIISSPEYRAANYYSGVRYNRGKSKFDAITAFVDQYGTDDQKSAWKAQNIAA